MSSSSSPCAACKFLRRKCTQECVFAPYFPPDQPQKFANVHKVFGASNVAKILNELTPAQREDAVNSLAYEAEARLRDPVYGCVGLISILQHRLKQVQHDLMNAKKELATYIGPSAMLPLLPQLGIMQQQMHYNNMQNMVGLGLNNQQLVIREPQQQQMMDHHQQQQLAAVREQQEMRRSYEQQQEMVRFSGGFDQVGIGAGGPGGYGQVSSSGEVSPVLALRPTVDGSYQMHAGQQEQYQHPHHQLQLQTQPQLLHQQNQQEGGPLVGP